MRFIFGIILGIAAGAALGLIMAPQSGKETRKALAKRMQSDAREVEEAAEAVTVD